MTAEAERNEAYEEPVAAEAFGDELPEGSKLLHGQYTITRFLNAGGFGITYLAQDSLDRTVVIKECFPESLCVRTGKDVRVAVFAQGDNADKATAMGLDLDIDAMLSDRLLLQIALGYNETEIDDPNLRIPVCGSGQCTVVDSLDADGFAIVDGNPLEDFSVVGTGDKWFDAEPRPESPETIRIIMKDGKIYKNTL